MGKKAKIGEYVLAIKTERGNSKKDRRYKVFRCFAMWRIIEPI